MVRQCHGHNRHEFEETLGDSGEQRSLTCYRPWGLRLGHSSSFYEGPITVQLACHKYLMLIPLLKRQQESTSKKKISLETAFGRGFLLTSFFSHSDSLGDPRRMKRKKRILKFQRPWGTFSSHLLAPFTWTAGCRWRWSGRCTTP